MQDFPPISDEDLQPLLDRAVGGEQSAMTEVLERYRPRLKQMVRVRLNQRLRGRIDESDIVQDAYLEAAKRLQHYTSAPKAPFFLWLRKITGQRIIDVHRRHLGAQARDVRAEVSFHRGRAPMATSVSLAAALLGGLTSPTQAAAKAEQRLALQNALAAMEPFDREILSLRHFESLTSKEAAAELGIEEDAASKRYLRAARRLKVILEDLGIVE